jgi:Enoyl-CoA hydratase/isomerase
MSGAFPSYEIDFLGADRFSALGQAPVFVVDASSWQSPLPDTQAVCVGIDSEGVMPEVDSGHFDVLLTTALDAPEPWVTVAPGRFAAHMEYLEQTVREWPMAATTMCRLLRLSEGLAFGSAVEIESLAYSALLGGSEFDRWRKSCALQPIPVSKEPLVLVERDADVVTLTLNHSGAQNAMTAAMRDALYTALANVLDDPTAPNVVLQGAGKCFSTGGALGEFGSATDLAQAHVVRTVRSCAALIDRLGWRATVRLHGACVGSGLEVPAAAARRIAAPDAWFQLPELRMGLIPGAGGTASVARAIGRHRTAWMLLSGKRIDARLALAWGLIHEIVG